jgi:hypothetical protein
MALMDVTHLVSILASSAAASSRNLPNLPGVECSICERPIFTGDRKFRSTNMHFECWERWDLASKACNYKGCDADVKNAWQQLALKNNKPGSSVSGEGADDDEISNANNDELAARRLRKRIAAEYGSENMGASDVRKLVLKISRDRVSRLVNKAVRMDKEGFVAHFKYVKGWRRKQIKRKWAEVEMYPQHYRTKKIAGRLHIWVPQNPEVSLEDVMKSSTLDEPRTLELDDQQADLMLYGKRGGVAPHSAATAVVGGPATIDADADDLLVRPTRAELKRVRDEFTMHHRTDHVQLRKKQIIQSRWSRRKMKIRMILQIVGVVVVLRSVNASKESPGHRWQDHTVIMRTTTSTTFGYQTLPAM